MGCSRFCSITWYCFRVDLLYVHVMNTRVVTYSLTQGQAVLHVACEHGLLRLVSTLLSLEADPNIQTTSSPADFSLGSSSNAVTRLTPLHVAIQSQHEAVVTALINHTPSPGTISSDTCILYLLLLLTISDRLILLPIIKINNVLFM